MTIEIWVYQILLSVLIIALVWNWDVRTTKKKMQAEIDDIVEDVRRARATTDVYAKEMSEMYYRRNMKDAYIAGSRCNKPQQSFESWLEETYKDVEPVDSIGVDCDS